jgi:hypothetical protein
MFATQEFLPAGALDLPQTSRLAGHIVLILQITSHHHSVCLLDHPRMYDVEVSCFGCRICHSLSECVANNMNATHFVQGSSKYKVIESSLW